MPFKLFDTTIADSEILINGTISVHIGGEILSVGVTTANRWIAAFLSTTA